MCFLDRQQSRDVLAAEIDENRSYFEKIARAQLSRFQRIPDQPEDVIQETFVDMDRRIDPPINYFLEDAGQRWHEFINPPFRAFPAHLSIRKTIVFKVRELNQKHNIRRSPQLPADQFDHIPAKSRRQNEVFDALEHCMELLSDEHRKILECAVCNSMSHAAIAEELGISVARVKARLSKARQRLRDCIETQLKT